MRTGLTKQLGIKALRKRLKLFASLRYRTLRSARKTRGERPRGDFHVSLTSYPKRFARLPITIKSLLTQTLLPQSITLYLAAEEIAQDPIPKAITNLQSDIFRIAVVQQNYRPYNKLIHALRERPDQRIVTVDDDRHYPHDLFETLYLKSLAHPEAVICGAGLHIALDDRGRLQPYKSWSQRSTPPHRAILPLGCSGVLYPPGALHADIDKPELFLDLAPTTDDLWFKMMSFLKGTPILSLGRPISDYVETELNLANTLWGHNRLGADDRNIVRLLEHYRIEAGRFAERGETGATPHPVA
jgi:hypothetical protein